MLVEFDMLKEDPVESFDRDRNKNMGIHNFYHKSDVTVKMIVEMDDVVDFSESFSYLNSDKVSTIDLRLNNNIFVDDIVIDLEDFKKVLSKVTGRDTTSAEAFI